ncbi:MAG TPA: response regulator [Azospirillaceae bacterium]|nr:response regulator [Azospirillaceae bacterium]
MTQKTVMVVEDDEGARYLLAKLLRKAGWEPVCVPDGLGCARALEDVAPAALLLDQRLPDTSGLDIARSIRARDGDRLPIIFVTAFASAEFVGAVRTIPNTSILAKPFLPETFLERFERCLKAA